jgi:signal transduction histidine kinase
VAYLALRFAGWPVYLGAFAGLAALVGGVPQPRRWVPLAAAGGIGVAVATGRPEGWAPDRIAVIAAVWAAVAVLAARMAQSRRRVAEEEAAGRVAAERLRIARELHDVLSHSLASISLQAGIGLHLVDRQPDQARAALQAIRQISADALGQARAALSVVRGSGPEPPAANPGLADLTALVESARAAGLAVDLETDVDGHRPADVDRHPVPDAIGGTAYRVVQEALTNVMRHAGPAAHARARVRRAGDWLEVEVTDDGVGSTAPAPGPGHGLRGMAERVGAVGGELTVGPAPGGVFVVRARLPLAPDR